MDAASVPFSKDLQIAQAALFGDEQKARLFVQEYLPDLESYLVSRCGRHDAKSVEKAREIAADVISDCFGAKNRPRGEDVLLRLYHGRAPLKIWLRHVAYSRLKSWWNSPDGNSLPLGPVQESLASTADPFVRDPEIVEILRIALENAFRQIEPYQLLFLRLVYIHSVRRAHLAQIWGCHPAKIGRDMAAAEERIRTLTLEYMNLIHPSLELQWADFQAISEKHPGLLHGSAEETPRL
ncbi:MAG: sigma-70 family RNA polymerase sigma factor [Verrucomicrobia bacterium]|nr:sigma-70 family RNA polymerase sigma factor [Verrucomicrobiota bacterium]